MDTDLPALLRRFPLGTRVSFRHSVDRFPHAVIPVASLGTVVDGGHDGNFAVRLDVEIEGLREWGNECHWYGPIGIGESDQFSDAFDDLVRETTATISCAGLPARHCGLNADWSVYAWHCGPSDRPNRVSGDLYILEDDDGETFTVVRRYFTDDGDDTIDALISGVTLVEAIDVAVVDLGGLSYVTDLSE